MQLHTLALHNFRCYEELRLELSGGLNVFVGSNASGKTSLLEAVFLLATTCSPRSGNDRDIVKWGTAFATASGTFSFSDHADTDIRVTLAGAGATQLPAGSLPSKLRGAKAITIDGQAVDSIRSVIGRVEAVFFAPDDLQMVKGAPAIRRHFLNTAIAQMMPRYLDDLARYRRALRQRNELLKRAMGGKLSGADLAPWTSMVCLAGAQIAEDRAQFVAQLHSHAQALHGKLSSGTEQLEVEYTGDLVSELGAEARQQLFHDRLEELTNAERRRGATLVGPHRDDLSLLVNGVSVRQFGSQGQQRTAALSLKLAEAMVMRARRGESPILLLDDCLSELDPSRTTRILELTSDFEQILLTSACTEIVMAGRPRHCHWYNIGGGAVSAGEAER